MKRNSFIRLLLSRPPVFVSSIFIIIFIITALFPGLLSPYNPDALNLMERLSSPTLKHLLGTDLLGRDTLSRLIFGARTALIIAVTSIIFGGVTGTIIGMLAGYFGGIIDSIIMRLTEAMMAIPQIVLALGIGAALGQSTLNLVIAIGISSLPAYIRMMRGQTLSIREQTYITAGNVIGCSQKRLMLLHILPNCLSPIIVTATINLGGAIMAEATLSFLGLGVTPPASAWGTMVSNGFQYLNTNPLLSIIPGLAIMMIVLSFNILGDGLRDMLDPRIRGSL